MNGSGLLQAKCTTVRVKTRDVSRRLSPWLPKTFEVKTSRVLLLLLHILLIIIDFRSYVDAIMSLYSIKYVVDLLSAAERALFVS